MMPQAPGTALGQAGAQARALAGGDPSHTFGPECTGPGLPVPPAPQLLPYTSLSPEGGGRVHTVPASRSRVKQREKDHVREAPSRNPCSQGQSPQHTPTGACGDKGGPHMPLGEGAPAAPGEGRGTAGQGGPRPHCSCPNGRELARNHPQK